MNVFVFIKKFDNIPDYEILSFETLLCSQWRQQCFVCFCKLFVSLWVNFYLWKIKWLAGCIEYLTEFLETILKGVYGPQVKFCILFSCRLVILPYDRTAITSLTFIGLQQFSWHFETDFGKFVRWCDSNSFLEVTRGSLNKIADDVVQCCLLPEVLLLVQCTTISDYAVFLSLCWWPSIWPVLADTWNVLEIFGTYSLNFLRWSAFFSSLYECHAWLATWNFRYSGDRQ